ncbi:hypothetical protein P3S67_026886 [Capsicum chacoense]
MRQLELELNGVVDNLTNDKISTLEKLLVSFPALEVCASSDYAKAVLQYLDTPACLEQPLDKLEYVAIDGFEGSEAELLFLMLLFSHTPSRIILRWR